MMQDEASSYYAALTRPISPTMIMNYIPPPVSNAGTTPSTSMIQVGSTGSPSGTGHNLSTTSSLRPQSATAALASSLNALEPGSQPTARPILHQGARSSHMEALNPPPQTSANQTSQQVRPPSTGGSSVVSAISSSSSCAEDPSSNSSRFARRGPLVMNHENGSFEDNNSNYNNPSEIRLRRESGAWSDVDNGTPTQNMYRQSFHQQTPKHNQQQQPFSPATPRTDMSNMASATGATFGMQIAKEGWLWRRGNLLTWKRCYAIGRFRGDAHPGILTLFKDNEHLFPIKTIDMAECFEVQVKAQDTRGSGRFEFKLVTRKEETWFATDTMSERTTWIDALNSLVSKAVGASLLKLEAKLNNIRHRNNSLEYSALSDKTGTTTAAALEEHLQLVQQDLATREQQLSLREQELERKRIESLLVQLEAWRAAAKVTVNQHYAVRDQLLERVMKTARTVQELLERARIHLETGSDQITEVVNSHLECIRVHASESSLTAASYKMIKSILVGLSVNLDTRSSEMKRVLLVIDQYIHASKSSNPRSASNSSPASPRLVGVRERRTSVCGPLPPPPTTTTAGVPPSTLGIGVHLIQIRNKYVETLEILEGHSKRLKRILERADVNNPESARRFQEDVKETLQSLTRHPIYVFTTCLPDQPLPGAVDTFYREDLVVIQQKSKELLRKSQAAASPPPAAKPASPLKRPQSADQNESDDDGDEGGVELEKPEFTLVSSSPKEPTAIPSAESQSIGKASSSSPSPPTVLSSVGTSSVSKLNPPLPASLSSFLLSETSPASVPTTVLPTFSSTELTQKIRDTILPEFDHLTIKQEESLQSMTSLLNQVSSALIKKLAEIKDVTAGQRQEFEELKDEIIDVMQLSATDPSSHQRDISALSEIRSKLADIAAQLAKVQTAQYPQQQQFNAAGAGKYYGGGLSGYRRADGISPSSGTGTSAATAAGFSLLQRSASTMVHNSAGAGAHPFYHTIDSGSHHHLQRVNSTSLQSRLQIPSSTSMIASLGSSGGLSTIATESTNNTTTSVGGPGPPGIRASKIAGMTRLFEENDPWNEHQATTTATRPPTDGSYPLQELDHGSASAVRHSQQVAAKLDQLLLLLEFVNTAQCRMMAYQDLEYDRHRDRSGSGNIDDARMMAVQEHMEQMDRKMNLQMHLLRRLACTQSSGNMLSVGGATTAKHTERIKQLEGDNYEEEASAVEVIESEDVLENDDDSLAASVESIVRTAPPQNELTLLEVLSRLDLQVIPSVRDQSERIHELSDQLSEMKRQLDEQHNRQELLQLQQSSNANMAVRSRSVAGTSNIGRSNSIERPATPLSHSRASSQTFIQQQQQQQASNSSLFSPLETELPSSWRASLRPSQSNGSNSASFRDRILSTSNIPPHPTAPSPAPLTSSHANLHDSIAPMSSTGGVSGGTLVTKTSDRIAELLDKMDSKMGQVIDEQLARYESGNKTLLAKVFELLEADEGLSEAGSETRVAQGSARYTIHRNFRTPGPTGDATHGDQDEQLNTENNALLKDIARSLVEDRANLEETKRSVEKILRGQEQLLETRSTHHPTFSSDDASSDVADNDVREANTHAWADSLDRIKTLIQQEGDRSEASMSDQRDEILEKMNQVLSSIQDSQTQFGSRDHQIREEVQEFRDWMVRHASQQTESLRELFLSTSATVPVTSSGVPVSLYVRGVGEKGDNDGSYNNGEFVGRGSSSRFKDRDGDSDDEEYAEVDILEDLDKRHNNPGVGGEVHPLGATFGPSPSVLPATNSTEIQELKDQLEMFTKVQMATFSELADNVSGVEKMMLDMSKMMGSGTSAVAPVPTASAIVAASPRVDVTATSRKSFSSAPPSPIVTTHTVAAAGGLVNNFDDDHYNNGGGMSGFQMQIQLEIHQDQLEHLYKRKARTEIEVEGLQAEKARLFDEKVALRAEVEQLRRERQELLLLNNGLSGGSDGEDVDGVKEVSVVPSSNSFLEKMLQDRVSLLLQETARLEEYKRQLEREARK
ncbi:hypothetical protein BGW39_001742 [Mortierella sp. 14UC]|nr:hypothetical protein BGW39_001742 [Mortierella sp. 14UC]